MKSYFLIIFLIIFSFQLKAQATIQEYMDSFYFSYLKERNVSTQDNEILNLLYKISTDKIKDIENFIKKSTSYDDKHYGICAFDEEYKDFLENINFELNYIPNCPLKRRINKKFKKAHKKYMRRLTKFYLD